MSLTGHANIRVHWVILPVFIRLWILALTCLALMPDQMIAAEETRPNPVSAPEPFSMQTLQSQPNAKPPVYYYVDPDGKLKLEDLASQEALADFTYAQYKTPSFGWTTNRFWFAIPFTTNDSSVLDPVFEISWPLLDHIKVYLLDQRFGRLSEWELGDKFDFYQRPIDHTNFVIPMELQANRDYFLFIRVESTSSVQLPVLFWHSTHYFEGREYFSAGQGLYYGSMLVMLIYNLFIFLSVRRATYLYYVGFVIGFIGLQSSLKGISFQYAWPHTPILSDYAISTGGAITLWFVVTFAKSFLKIEPHFKVSYRLLTGFQWAITVVALASLVLPYSLIIKFVAGFGAIASLSCIVVGWMRLLAGQREARFYVAAWMVIVTGTVLYMGKQFGMLPRNFFTENSMQFGSILEVVLLSFALADRLNTLKRELQVANRKLEAHLANVEQQVEEKTKDIRSIMKTIRQGIFMITPDNMTVHPDYSSHTRDILHKDKVAGKNVMDLVFDDTTLSANDKDQLLQSLFVSLGEDRLNFDSNVSCLPTEVVYRIEDGHQRILELDWDPITDENEIVDRVLISIRDITEYRHLVTKSQRDDLDLQIISEIVRVDPHKFASIMASCFELLGSCREILSQSNMERKRLIEDLYRYLHTIKGQARSFGLSLITDTVHEVESDVAVFRDLQHALDLHVIEQGLAEVELILKTYDDIDTVKLQRRAQSTSRQVLELATATQWIHKVEDLTSDKVEPYREFVAEIRTELIKATSVQFNSVVEECFFNAKRMATDLGRTEPKLNVTGPDLYVTHKAASLFRQVFTHLMNNAVDHGMETRLERERIGKPSHGHFNLKISVDQAKAQVHLAFWDDGRGLQLERLRLKAGELGFSFASDDRSIANLIFENGLTTAEMLTNISGRGVGLDAIRIFIKEAGGSVSAELDEVDQAVSDRYHPFKINISLPVSLFTNVADHSQKAA